MKAHVTMKKNNNFLLLVAIDSVLVQEACCTVSLHSVLHTSGKNGAIQELLMKLTSQKSFSSLKENNEPVLNHFLIHKPKTYVNRHVLTSHAGQLFLEFPVIIMIIVSWFYNNSYLTNIIKVSLTVLEILSSLTKIITLHLYVFMQNLTNE